MNERIQDTKHARGEAEEAAESCELGAGHVAQRNVISEQRCKAQKFFCANKALGAVLQTNALTRNKNRERNKKRNGNKREMQMQIKREVQR